jgi:hypothetical protein
MTSQMTRFVRLLRRGRLPNIKFHLMRARQRWKERAAHGMDMVSIVSLRPTILLVGCHPKKMMQYVQSPLSRIPMTILYRAGWSMEHGPTFEDRVSSIREAQQRYPNHRYVFAANTRREVELVRASGLKAEFLNENAFIDEFSFSPDDSIPKEFDAVLDAQIARYKRLELASLIPSLLIITFVMRERFNADYAQLVRKSLSHANWANGPFWENSYRKLVREEVAAQYRRAKVGLCLSAMEGANLASIQYLLSGLSVVSTESVGGRDNFFEPEYSRIVAPDPKAIAVATGDLVRNAPPAAEVRRRTLEKVWAIRNDFAKLLIDEYGHAPVDAAWWKEFNRNRRIRYQSLTDVASQIAAANE